MSRMGEDLVEAMKEALAHSEGKLELRTSRLNISPVCTSISVEDIKETRQKLGVSQGSFAIVMGVSKKTVESWEEGRYKPNGTARRLLSILQADPTVPEKFGIMRK
jgi:putative transcriptional regulator